MLKDSAKSHQGAEPQSNAKAQHKVGPTPTATTPPTTPHSTQTPTPRGPTKTTLLVALLSEGSGCDAATISATFGWQAHTTRAAVSGLRKAGFDVAKEGGVEGGATRYRIVAAPEAKDAAPEAKDAGATP